MYLNKALIIGNLTRDIELKSMPNGSKVATFSVATNLVFKDQQGNKKEQVEFHNIVVFGKQAETSAQYLVKGQSVLIEGRIQTRSWEDKTSGEKKYRTEIIADRVQFGSKPQGTQSVATGRDDAGFNSAEKPAVQTGGYEGKIEDPMNYDAGDINVDEIPF